jgi:hypothetical protein
MTATQTGKGQKMAKAFTKGDRVTLLIDWDLKGTVVFYDAIVHSCGKVQMVLTDAHTGEELGRHFQPAIATGLEFGTRPEMQRDEIETLGLEIAAAELVKREAEILDFFERTKNSELSGKFAAKHRDEDLAKLHAPTVRTHAEACQKVEADVAAMLAG